MRLAAASAAALLAALLAPLAARAENASAALLPGDRLHGNIVAPGETDRLLVWLPANATFSAEALAEKGSAILPTLEVLGPADAPLDLAAFSTPGPGGVGVKVTGKTKRKFRPNLQRVRALVGGAVRRVRVCSRCIKSGRVQKPPARNRFEAPTKAAAAN